MNIWIFNHHAQAPTIPGGTRHYDLARQLVDRGHTVTIFAAGFHYTLLAEMVNYNGKSYKVEDIDNVKFVWVKTIPYTDNNWKRMVNILSYGWKLNFLIPKLNLVKPDIIIGTTVHPIAPIIAQKFAKKYKTPFIFEIRDLWPQSFIDMGVWRENSLKSKLFQYIEKYTVKKADKIIVLSPKTKHYLDTKYNFTNSVYIPNSVDLDSVRQSQNKKVVDPTIDTLKSLKDEGKFLAVFTGAIVQTNTINVFVDIARMLVTKNIYIVLVGKGQERDKYEKKAKKESLDNLVFLDPVEKKHVPNLLAIADVLLLVQGNIQWGSSNKLYDYMAVKKPIVTSLYAQHNDIVEKINCGYSSKYNDSHDFADKILEIYNLEQRERDAMGKNAYAYVENNYDITFMAEKLEKTCESTK